MLNDKIQKRLTYQGKFAKGRQTKKFFEELSLPPVMYPV